MKSLLMSAVLLALPVMAQAVSLPPSSTSQIRTQLVARNEVVISSQISARIDRLDVKEGDSFRRGQLLVGFDCGMLAAQLARANASSQAAHKQLQVNERLAELQSVGQLELEQARAKARETAAEATYGRASMAGCRITAPFDGRVAKRAAAPAEYVTPGKPLLQIVDTGNLEVQLIVPSRWLRWLKPGTEFTVHVDDLDLDVPATISRLGAAIDPVSQTVTVSGRITAANPSLLPGMSGVARFTQPR